MSPTRTVINGIFGKMGQEVLNAVTLDPETQVVGAVARSTDIPEIALPDGSGNVPVLASLVEMASSTKPDVIVDFTSAESARAAFLAAASEGIHFVTGTSGFTSDDLDNMNTVALDKGIGAIFAPNFALGAILLMHLAESVVPHAEFTEIVEMHHNKKSDAPSGTAMATAERMLKVRGKDFDQQITETSNLEGARGGSYGGISIHSIRLPGLMAHQEIIFGLAGQTLTLRHDTINRECYMPGVLLAIKRVLGTKGLTVGLESFMGLKSIS
ncbi:MAG: 4-hydroxy-tetrahydrodipicolinate reductase [SAR202 cluster bacterium]|nr:4-hydroxy-tetrahydrodipicolinate reductase [SAR202 cluster bacterium]|tara:strand:+ start:545 stop:1354 length:810 start_codon:yes stop_codon:yes gene_type:complete